MGFRRKVDQLEPTKVPSALDVAWAAGIYEGEGCCQDYHTRKRVTARVTQKDPELLYSLRELFGGSVVGQGNKCQVWLVCGDRARYFLALIYPRLTARRKAQVDMNGALSFLGGSDPAILSSAQIHTLLSSRPTVSRKGRIPVGFEEAKQRRADGARAYWAKPENLEKRRAQNAARRQFGRLGAAVNKPISQERVN